jgi:uncharacterized membrane protein
MLDGMARNGRSNRRLEIWVYISLAAVLALFGTVLSKALNAPAAVSSAFLIISIVCIVGTILGYIITRLLRR